MEAIPELLVWIDRLKREARNDPKEFLAKTARGAFKGAASLADMLPAAVPGGQPGNLREWLDKRWGEDDSAADTLGSWLNPPGTKALTVAPLLAGALRHGGNKALMASHASPINKLAVPGINDGKFIDELYSPSFAVTGHELLRNPFLPREGGALLIPREGAFDPKYDVTTLFSRDAYTGRAQDYPGFISGDDTVDVAAKLRLGDRLNKTTGEGHDRLAELYQALQSAQDLHMAPGHLLSIEQSRAFPSFKAYEADPTGAKLLTLSQSKLESKANALDQDIKAYLGSKGYKRDYADQDYWLNAEDNYLSVADLGDFFRANAMGGDAAAIHILQQARRIPSEYGELKVHGPSQITPEKYAGMLLVDPNNRQGWLQEQATKYYSDKGIPVVPSAPSNPSVLFEMAKMLQEKAGPYAGRVPKNP